MLYTLRESEDSHRSAVILVGCWLVLSFIPQFCSRFSSRDHVINQMFSSSRNLWYMYSLTAYLITTFTHRIAQFTATDLLDSLETLSRLAYPTSLWCTHAGCQRCHSSCQSACWMHNAQERHLKIQPSHSDSDPLFTERPESSAIEWEKWDTKQATNNS